MDRKSPASESPEYSENTSSELVTNTSDSDFITSAIKHDHDYGQKTTEKNGKKKAPIDLENQIPSSSKCSEKQHSVKKRGKEISTRTKSNKEKFSYEVGNTDWLRIQTDQLYSGPKSKEKCNKEEPSQLEIKMSSFLKSSKEQHSMKKTDEKTSPRFKNKEKEATDKENVLKRTACSRKSSSGELKTYSPGTQHDRLHPRTKSEGICNQEPKILEKQRSSSIKSTTRQCSPRNNKNTTQQHQRKKEKPFKISDSTESSDESMNSDSSGMQPRLHSSRKKKEQCNKAKPRKSERKAAFSSESLKNKNSMKNTSEKTSPLAMINTEKVFKRTDHNREIPSNKLGNYGSSGNLPQTSHFRKTSENICSKKVPKKSKRIRPYSTEPSKKYHSLKKSVEVDLPSRRSNRVANKKIQNYKESSSDFESDAAGHDASLDRNRIDRTKGVVIPQNTLLLAKKACSFSATQPSCQDLTEPGSSSIRLKIKLNNKKDCGKDGAAARNCPKVVRNDSLKIDLDKSSSENDNLNIDEDKSPSDLSDFGTKETSDAKKLTTEAHSSPATLPGDPVLVKNKISSPCPNLEKACRSYDLKQNAGTKNETKANCDEMWNKYRKRYYMQNSKNRNEETGNSSKIDDAKNADSKEPPYNGTNVNSAAENEVQRRKSDSDNEPETD